MSPLLARAFPAKRSNGPPSKSETVPARLLDDERPGGHVPGLELELPEPVEPAAGDVAEVQGGRAAAADRLGPDDELAELPDVVHRAGPDVVGETRGQERLPQLGDLGDRERGAR